MKNTVSMFHSYSLILRRVRKLVVEYFSNFTLNTIILIHTLNNVNLLTNKVW